MNVGGSRSLIRVLQGGLLLVVLCLPPALVHLDKTAPSRIMENLSILTSQETWLRVRAGDADGWVVPTWNGYPRVNKPPLLVWVNLLAWADLTPEKADLEQLVWRARLASLLFGALTLAATFWAGYLLGGRSLAAIATLITGTGMLFIRQVRYAAYDTHLLGWVTLAVVAGLWAMQGRREQRVFRRSLAGWTLAGLALGAAVLTKGPLALVLGLGPLTTMTLLATRHRRANLAGIGMAALLAVALALPWHLHVLRGMPEAMSLLGAEYRAERDHFQPPWYYLCLIGLVFPWTFGLLRAVLRWSQREFHPTGGHALAWGWFLFLFFTLSLPGAKQHRYILPILPATGLVVAGTWLAGIPTYRGRWRPVMERALIVLHWVALPLVASLLAAFLLVQDRMIAAHTLMRPELVGLAPWVGLVLLPLVVILAGLGWRWQRAGRQAAAAWASAAAMSVVATVILYGYAPAPAQQFRCRLDTLRIHERVGGEPLYFLDLHRPADRPLSKEFLMYTRRIVPVLDSSALATKVRAGESFFVATRITGHDDADLVPVGLQPVTDFRDGEKWPLRLFYREAGTSTARDAGAGAPEVRR